VPKTGFPNERICDMKMDAMVRLGTQRILGEVCDEDA